MYVSPPDVIKTNAGKNFITNKFINNATLLVIEVKEVLVEVYYLINKVKRYYAPIRRAYRVISVDVGRTTAPEHIL
jgi:hypothetical protein